MPSNRREIPFTGPSYQSANTFLSNQECINYFLEAYPTRKGDKFVLRGAPGLRQWVDVGTNAPIRGMWEIGSNLIVVSSNKVFKVTSGGTVTLISNILDIADTVVSMAENGVQVMITNAAGNGFIYTASGETLQVITDPSFPGATHVTFLDGFFLVNRPNTAQFFKSGLNNGLVWDSLDFSAAGWKPDNLVGIFSDHRDLWLPGTDGIEIWYNNGSTTAFNFSRREGAEIEVGLAAPDSMDNIDNAVFWLGRNKQGQGRVFRALGFQAVVISTPPITEAINSYSSISDAIGFTYLVDSHPMYELTFPSGDATWVFDSSTSQWHERQSRRTEAGGKVVIGRHRGQNHVFFGGKSLMGDLQTGKIWEHRRDVYKEGSFTMPAIRTTLALEDEQDPLSILELQILYTPGVGLQSGQGSDPVAILDWSVDGGFTWSNEHHLPIGKVGAYENRARELQLGQGRNWIFRVKVTDPVLRDIMSAFAIIEVDSA